MRSLFSAHITFGLITIPVGLYSALEAAEHVRFHQFHRKDMAPIRYKKFCSEEDVEVPNDEIVKGFEAENKRVAVVEEKELEEIEEGFGGHDHTIDVLEFVDFGTLNPLSFEKPYYLAPQKGGEKAYGVLRDALFDARRAGIARVMIRKRPRLAALLPSEKVLSCVVLRAFEELRNPADLHIPAAHKKPAEVKMARLLIDQLSTEGGFDPTQHPNEYRQAIKKLLAKKRTFGVAPKHAEGDEEKKENVVDLMEALKKSLAKNAAKGGKATAAGSAKASAAKGRHTRHRKSAA